MRVAGLVLAAGRASRFGSTKQVVDVDGRPLVRHAVDAAVAALLDPVVVVVGHDADVVVDVLPEDVVVVHNERYADGQSTSLRAGLEALADSDADAVVILLADEPGVGPAAIEAVVRPLARGAPMARTRYLDRVGHPVALHRAVWDEARATTGDRGAGELLRSPRTVLVPAPRRAPVDVDVPADLEGLDRASPAPPGPVDPDEP